MVMLLKDGSLKTVAASFLLARQGKDKCFTAMLSNQSSPQDAGMASRSFESWTHGWHESIFQQYCCPCFTLCALAGAPPTGPSAQSSCAIWHSTQHCICAR